MKRVLPAVLLAALLAGAGASYGPGAARAAGPDDPAAWTVRARAEQLEALVAWNGRLAGADRFGGLILLEPTAGQVQVFTTRDGLTVNDLRDLAVDDQQRLWVATAGGGLVRFDAQGAARRITGLVSLEVTAVAVAGDVVYYGTASAGAGRIAGVLPDATYTVQDGLVDARIRSVALHGERAWFGTQAGVSEFSNNVFTTRDQGLGLVFVYDLIAGPAGVFVATDLGVHRFDDGAQSWVPAGSGLAGGIRALAFDGADVLALAFAGGGTQQLYRLAEGTTAWEGMAVPAVDREFTCVVRPPAGDLWLGGQVLDPLAVAQDPRALLHRVQPAADVVVRQLFGSHVQGKGAIDSDGAGGAWLAMEAPRQGVNHLRPDGSVSAYAYVAATAGTGFCSMQSRRALKRAQDGSVWVSSIGSCVTRVVPHATDDPLQATYEDYTEENSGIRTRRVINIAQDDLGRLWFLSDGVGEIGDPLNKGLDILLDPAAPAAAGSWLQVRADTGELGGDAVRHVAFAPAGVAWLCVDGIGVQRWDVDGPTGGEAPAATASNPLRWDTVNENSLELSGINGIKLDKPNAVVVAGDGTLWIASDSEGLVHLDYDRGYPWRLLDRLQQRLFGAGLLSGSVKALAMDRSGAIWAATSGGLNRVRGTGADLVVDAYTTLPAFDGQLYTPDVISPLPGANVLALHFDAARDLLHIGTQTGYASIHLDATARAGTEAEIFLYPNPLREGQAGLRIGGFSGTATVRVLTLLGVELLREDGVQPGDLVWDARYVASGSGTSEDRPVASGLYIVVIEVDGRRIQRTLAVER